MHIHHTPSRSSGGDGADVEIEHRVQGLRTGPSIEKTVAPLRSFVGAKRLNLAASEIHYLSGALIDYYGSNDRTVLDRYSDRALARIWKAERFSWWMITTLHKMSDHEAFEVQMQIAESSYIADSKAAQTASAENYVGLPY